MSDDLISRKAAIEEVKNTILGASDFAKEIRQDFIDILERVPTAYDIDKVEERLLKERSFWVKRGILPVVNIDKAIEIVKAGGKE